MTAAEVLHRRTVRRIKQVCEELDWREQEADRASREADGRHFLAPPGDRGDGSREPRRCTRCGGSFPAEDFPWQEADGRRHSWCRACNRAAQRAYRQARRGPDGGRAGEEADGNLAVYPKGV